jgi:hypothetical protein
MERFGIDDARDWDGPVRSWLRGWESLAWHAQLAAVASAGLVLANVAFSPANLWSLWVMAVWTALLALHAVAVAVAARAVDGTARAAVPVPVANRTDARPGAVGAEPLFSDHSPTVGRPRPWAEPGSGAKRTPVDLPANEAPDVPAPIAAATAAPAIQGPVAAGVVPPSPPAVAPAAAKHVDRDRDVAVAVTVLPAPGDRTAPARIVPAATAPQPVLPERVVALWGGARVGASPAPAADWGHPAFAPSPWSPEASAASAD